MAFMVECVGITITKLKLTKSINQLKAQRKFNKIQNQLPNVRSKQKGQDVIYSSIWNLFLDEDKTKHSIDRKFPDLEQPIQF